MRSHFRTKRERCSSAPLIVRAVRASSSETERRCTICHDSSHRSSDAMRSLRRSRISSRRLRSSASSGTGGAGKTRAAVEVGRRLLNQFPHGVWFVELAPLSDSALVPQALAGALRVQESPRRSLLETLIAFLANKRLLIILDNCEHVISQARAVAGSLLHACPTVALLATSREALSITGERTYQIPSLAVPRQSRPSPVEAEKYGAVALFVDRVQAAASRFELTVENVKPVVEICRRLDGLPLALELAAARASVLSPQEICDRLDRVFDVLTGAPQASVPRHATMRTVIDWSYELLSPQAQLLLRAPRRLRWRIYSGDGDDRLRRREHSSTRRLRVALVAYRPIARHGRRCARQRALSSTRRHETIRGRKAGGEWRTTSPGSAPRARASSGSRPTRSAMVRRFRTGVVSRSRSRTR